MGNWIWIVFGVGVVVYGLGMIVNSLEKLEKKFDGIEFELGKIHEVSEEIRNLLQDIESNTSESPDSLEDF
ncbi:MAG: hypothetical protein ACYSU6_04690 [Planctomycetota bacterium]|jgi:hypothetical protein